MTSFHDMALVVTVLPRRATDIISRLEKLQGLVPCHEVNGGRPFPEVFVKLFRTQFHGLSEGVVQDTQNRHGKLLEHLDTQLCCFASRGKPRFTDLDPVAADTHFVLTDQLPAIGG